MRKINLELARHEYLAKMRFIIWEASQWMQYREYTFDEKRNQITLFFKSSSYGIGFDITIQTNLTDEDLQDNAPFLNFMDTYEFFKNIKYNECTRISVKDVTFS